MLSAWVKTWLVLKCADPGGLAKAWLVFQCADLGGRRCYWLGAFLPPHVWRRRKSYVCDPLADSEEQANS